MSDLTPISSPKRELITHALQSFPLPQLSGSDARPYTFFVARQQAGQLSGDALVACLHFMLGEKTPLLAVCGGIASPSFKAHPTDRKLRIQVVDREVNRQLLDFRIERPNDDMIIVMDPNRLGDTVEIISTFAELSIPVALLYVAERRETQSAFVDLCNREGLRPIVLEEHTGFAPRGQESLIFPAIPEQVRETFQGGLATFPELMKQASPGTQIFYRRACKLFLQQLEGQLHG